jgi:hypothetical protein
VSFLSASSFSPFECLVSHRRFLVFFDDVKNHTPTCYVGLAAHPALVTHFLLEFSRQKPIAFHVMPPMMIAGVASAGSAAMKVSASMFQRNA